MRFLQLLILATVAASACTTSRTGERSPAQVGAEGAQPSMILSQAKYDIIAWSELPVKIEDLKATLDGAINEFQTKVAPFPGKIRIVVDPPKCFQVGYIFSHKQVEFCHYKNVINEGFSAIDVVRHEIFHAMLCQLRPDVCTRSAIKKWERLAIHEALADFFAYDMAGENHDNCYGKNFYPDHPCERHYILPTCYALISGPHPMGNAIGSTLISSGVTLEKLRPFLLNGDFTIKSMFQSVQLPITPCYESDPNLKPQISFEMTGDRPSPRLRIFWLKPDVPLSITVTGNAVMNRIYPNWTLNWVRRDDGLPPKLMQFLSTNIHSFTVSSSATSGSEAMDLQILNGKDVIATYEFGFGIKNF